MKKIINTDENYKQFIFGLMKFFVQDFVFDIKTGNKKSAKLFKTYLQTQSHSETWLLICGIIGIPPKVAKEKMLEFCLELEGDCKSSSQVNS